MNIQHSTTGKGIPFIFQHGLAANKTQPQALLSGIEGVEVVSMDSPGHGESALPDRMTPSFDFYADRVLSLMNQLSINSAYLGGISMGAGISLNIALRAPERVRGLVLVRPAWVDERRPENLRILLDAANCMRNGGGIEAFESIADFNSINRDLPSAGNSVLGVFDSSQRKEIPLVLESMINDRPFHNLPQLEAINKPCLIIGNGDDPLHPFKISEILQKAIRGSDLKKVTSRYIDSAEHQQQVINHISQFIFGNEKSLER